MNQRDDMVELKIVESVIADGTHCFGCKSLPPLHRIEAISDFDSFRKRRKMRRRV